MKNKILLYTLIIGFSSFNFWAQQNTFLNKKELEKSIIPNSIMNAQVINSTTKRIKYYHVEEIVSSKFGGYKTIYNVSNPITIRTYDLGPNGKRIVTPVYDEKQLSQNEQIIKQDHLFAANKSKSSVSDVTEKKDSNTYIDIIKTYERVADKGYESIDMLKKMGNSYFFNNEFEKAEKCYSKLFKIASDLEPFYYYRYSITLKSTGDIQKSEDFLIKFNQLSSTASRQ